MKPVARRRIGVLNEPPLTVERSARAAGLSGGEGRSGPLLLSGGHEPPAWILDYLTERQARDHTSKVWRWRLVIIGVELPGRTKAVAHVIVTKCRDDQAVCWPSMELLSAETGFSRHPVEKAIAELEGHGFLVVERDAGRGSRYYLAWPAEYEPADDPRRCGEPNAAGEPCRRRAGWGTDRADGPCKAHADDTPRHEKPHTPARQAGVPRHEKPGYPGTRSRGPRL